MSSQPIQSAELSKPFGIRAQIYAALFDTNRPGNYQERFDSFTATLIIANLLALMLEHVPAIHEPNAGLFHVFDMFSLVVFTVEYVLRFYTAPEMPEFKGKGLTRLRWATQPMSIIDLAAILPFYLSLFISVDLRALRALRLLRLLKLTRILVPAIREFRERNVGRTFRQKVHSLFFLTPQSGALGSMIDSFFAFWVLLSPSFWRRSIRFMNRSPSSSKSSITSQSRCFQLNIWRESIPSRRTKRSSIALRSCRALNTEPRAERSLTWSQSHRSSSSSS